MKHRRVDINFNSIRDLLGEEFSRELINQAYQDIEEGKQNDLTDSDTRTEISRTSGKN